MSLSPIKYEILATILLLDKPEKAINIAKETGKGFPSIMMHIIGLTRMGYTASPQKGLYALTEKGKKALGIPQVNRENAQTLLAGRSDDSSFKFYAGLGKPLDLQARGLQDFYVTIVKLNPDSIDFHINRGDFEAWFAELGDGELAKKTALLKEKKMSAEELRSRLAELVKNRCTALANMTGHAISTE